VRAKAAANLIGFYVNRGKLQPARKMYRNDLTRLAMEYPNSDEVRLSYALSADMLKRFGGLF
jgi:hypothetical protein